MPLFYGMWVFSNATRNNPVLRNVTIDSTNPFIKVWAVYDATNTWTVVVIHKDANATLPASVIITSPDPVAEVRNAQQ